MIHLICSEKVDLASLPLQSGDALVFLNAGVYHCMHTPLPKAQAYYAISDDLKIRGLGQAYDQKILTIDYPALVKLLATAPGNVTWR